MQTSFYDWLKEGFTSIPNKIFNNYHRLNLTSDEMVLVLFLLSQISQFQSIENIAQTSENLGWSQNKMVETLNSLMNKGYLEIELVENAEGKKTDHYTLRPFFVKINEMTSQCNDEQQSSADKPRSIVASFEEEFGRTLTQIELETLNTWLHQNKYHEELVYLALKQAVINNAISLKYIDRILLNWEKQNIRTLEEAQREIERFEAHKAVDRNTLNDDDHKYDHLKIPLNYWNNQY